MLEEGEVRGGRAPAAPSVRVPQRLHVFHRAARVEQMRLAKRPDRDLCAITRLDLPQQPLHVDLHGSFSDLQFTRNDLVGQSTDKAFDYLMLTSGERNRQTRIEGRCTRGGCGIPLGLNQSSRRV